MNKTQIAQELVKAPVGAHVVLKSNDKSFTFEWTKIFAVIVPGMPSPEPATCWAQTDGVGGEVSSLWLAGILVKYPGNWTVTA